MLTKYDELICHQLATTFDHVYTSDARWTERIVLYGFDISGKLNFVTGLARYPNRNVIDAYGMVTIDNKRAHVVRASNELRPETGAGVAVGPFSYEIVEPLKKVRMTLDKNKYGLAFELDFDGTFPAYEQVPMFFRDRGRILEEARRYYQVGRFGGWFKVGGKTYRVDAATTRGGRDHSWGVRRGVGGGAWPEPWAQPGEVPQGAFYFMCIADFGRWATHVAQRENWDGQIWHFEGWETYPLGSKKQDQVLKLVSLEHDFQFLSHVRVAKSGTVTVKAADGTKKKLSLQRKTTFYPGFAGYDYYRDYCSGMWKGPSYIDGFEVDITDPEELKKASFLTETLCEYKCGKDVGYGLLEMVNVGKYPRYGYKGY
ncbi:MAG: hypothetical protein QUS33_05825 [Dehalococcoidia bacterium]|nr:hypothetical protein [Dehalococcoidia bacterium]